MKIKNTLMGLLAAAMTFSTSCKDRGDKAEPGDKADAQATYSVEHVKEKIEAMGATDWKKQKRSTDSLRGNAYREAYEFTIAEVSPKGGQVIFFDNPKFGKQMEDYYNSLSGMFACPYVYLSDDSKTLFQLNNGLTPQQASEVAKIIGK